jgi:protein disulfide-isomerase A6
MLLFITISKFRFYYIFLLAVVYTGLLTIFVSGCYALYPSSSEVVDLTPANFDRLVIQSDALWIVEFYAPWCGHCQQFVPEYSKAATALKVNFMSTSRNTNC